MPEIRILSEKLINKIAAGEVVQRPASVVKELIENSLDASASKIFVDIENGGRDLIRVMDNGSGMDEDDLMLSFEQHATSKIREHEDLEGIRSLGFRGEALPSIASVSMVEAASCCNSDNIGSQIIINGGDIRGIEPFPMKQGTHITVKKLFFNVPARRKFLKSASTEYRHMIDVIRRFSLCRPDVEFQFISNGKSVFNLKPSELKNRISQVFAVHYHEKLIGVEAQDGSAKLTGFVGNLDLIRNRSGEQYLFVNNRLVNDRMMNSAVYQAFSPMIEKGEFPFFVLNLDLPASEIDVNVHPQKTEIKYHQDWFVYQFIRRTVAGVLEKNLTVVPTFNHNQRFPGNTLFSSEPGIQQQEIKISPLSGSAGYAPSDPVSSIPEPEPLPDGHPLKERIDLFSSNISRDRQITNTDNIISIWQAHNKYIFAQIASGIIVIDQHAAHERILFEKALTTFQNESARASQQLLFPVSLTVSPDDYSYFADLLHEFEQLGFSLREFGRNTLLIEAVPADLRHIGEGRIVLEILDFFKTRQTVKNRKQYNMAASYACKAAIKSGDLLQPREMQQLIDELFQTQTPYACPHGRPTIIHLTLDELDKRFHRT